MCKGRNALGDFTCKCILDQVNTEKSKLDKSCIVVRHTNLFKKQLKTHVFLFITVKAIISNIPSAIQTNQLMVNLKSKLISDCSVPHQNLSSSIQFKTKTNHLLLVNLTSNQTATGHFKTKN